MSGDSPDVVDALMADADASAALPAGPPAPPPAPRALRPEDVSGASFLEAGNIEAENAGTDGMLMIQQSKPRAERVAFTRKNVILAYAAAAHEAGIEPTPTSGFGANTKFGPFFAYVDFSDAQKLAEQAKGVLHVRGDDAGLHELKIKALRIDYHSNSPAAPRVGPVGLGCGLGWGRRPGPGYKTRIFFLRGTGKRKREKHGLRERAHT